MLYKSFNIFFYTLFLLFIFSVGKYYFSNKNIMLTNKSRSSFVITNLEINENIPLLKNNTNDIIVYKDGLTKFKKKRKKRIWEKLISNSND